jgi:hypothetical protein
MAEPHPATKASGHLGIVFLLASLVAGTAVLGAPRLARASDDGACTDSIPAIYDRVSPVARTRLREGFHSRPPMELPAHVLAG